MRRFCVVAACLTLLLAVTAPSASGQDPETYLIASYDMQWIFGTGFGANTEVTINWWGPGGDPVWDDTRQTDDGGSFFYDGFEHDAAFLPGDTLSVSDGAITKILHLVSFNLQRVDRDFNTVSGITAASLPAEVEIWVDIWAGENPQVQAQVDGLGNWVADFTGVWDIDVDQGAGAVLIDEDGDRIFEETPSINASLVDRWVGGYPFTPGATVEIEILDPSENSFGPWEVVVDETGGFFLAGGEHGVQDLGPGWTVNAVELGSGMEKHLVLADIGIDLVDRDLNVVQGYGPPGDRVAVDVWNDNEAYRLEPWADDTGLWIADFGAVGAAILEDMTVSVIHPDGDNDATRLELGSPSLRGVIGGGDLVLLGGWISGEVVTLEVWSDASTSELLATQTVTIGDGGQGQAPFPGLAAGNYVVARSAVYTKKLTLVDLTATIDVGSDTVTGTAGPRTRLQVLAGTTDPWGGGAAASADVLADDLGNWEAPFAGSYDFSLGDGAVIVFEDGDGDATVLIGRAWTLLGFYRPVDMDGVWNTVKGGSTVPLKFRIYAGGTELTDVGAVDRFTVEPVACPSGGYVADPIEFTASGGTVLRYSDGQFIQNWQTPKRPGACYRVTMTADDGSSLTAYFKLK